MDSSQVPDVCSRCQSRLDGSSISFGPFNFGNFAQEPYLLSSGQLFKNNTLNKFRCPLCLGLMHLDDPHSYLPHILLQTIIKSGQEGVTFDTINPEIVIPTNAYLREICIKGLSQSIHYRELKDFVREQVISILRHVLDQSHYSPTAPNKSLPQIPNAPKAPSGCPFHLRISFGHPSCGEELQFLNKLNRQPKSRFPTRKKRRQENLLVSTATLLETFGSLSPVDLELSLRSFSSDEDFSLLHPLNTPSLLSNVTLCRLTRETIYFTGSYIKHSRLISQSPWRVHNEDIMGNIKPDGSSAIVGDDQSLPLKPQEETPLPGEEQNTDSLDAEEEADEQGPAFEIQEIFKEVDKYYQHSIEGMISHVFKMNSGSNQILMVASGREDVDVRMLGNGRDFALMVKNARRYIEDSPEWIASLQERINAIGQGRLLIHGLSYANVDSIKRIHVASETHRKVYRAVVWTADPIHTQEVLNAALLRTKPFRINQKTPIRVLHRRSAMTRPKFVYWMIPRRINNHFLELTLEAQAGTYIKELVHSDLGRTAPSVRMLLGCDADIIQLDVLELVDMSAPSKYEDYKLE